MRFQNKVIVITGATGGIGEATARRLHAEGASVVLIGRSESKLRDLRDDIGSETRLAYAVAEANDEVAIASAFQMAQDRFGGMDGVIANAGTEGRTLPIELTGAFDFRHVMETNVTGVFLCIKHAVRFLRRRGGGAIVATASLSGLVGVRSAGAYVASKHAVCGLVKSAALELGSHGIRVNAVAPGPIENRMMRSIEQQLGQGHPGAVKSRLEDRTALGRYGSNDDVAGLIAFLASDEARYCTGSVHLIDGGYCAA